MREYSQWRSQVTDDARALHAFVFIFLVWGGGRLGACSPSKFCILEVATQIVLDRDYV